jgi:Bacteriophage related domain of unknown function
MPIDQVHQAVGTFLGANWSATDVAFENDGYVPHTDTDGSIAAWVLVELYGGLYEQVSIGAGSAHGNFWTDSGTLWLHIFVASETGSLVAKQHAAALAELFRGLELEPNIEFGDISIAPSGGSEDGNNWSLSISIDWAQG